MTLSLRVPYPRAREAPLHPTAPPPTPPQIPAFPSKGPPPGRPEKLIQPVSRWEESSFLPQLSGYTCRGGSCHQTLGSGAGGSTWAWPR